MHVPQPRLRNIQALRFVAAALVVLYHFDGLHYLQTGRYYAPGLKYCGFFGVDLFFAISGAIMVYVSADLRGPRASAWFLYRRMARVYSAYWLSVALAIAVFVLRFPGTPAFDPLQSVLLLPGPIDQHVNSVAWTLTYEVFFYLCFSVVLLFPRRQLLPIVAGTAAGIAVLTALGLSRSLHSDFALAYLLEFLAGCAAAILALRLRGRGSGRALALAFAILAGAIIWQAANNRLLPDAESLRIAILVPAAALIAFAAVGMELDGRIVAPRWLARLGDWSYSIYLLQLPFYWALMHLFAYVFALPTTLRGAGLIALALAEIAIAGVLSALVELPVYRALQQGGRRWLACRRAATGSAPTAPVLTPARG